MEKPLLSPDIPLFKATELGEMEVTVGILEENPNLINTADEQGSTALFTAAWCGNVDMVELLLHYGADPNITNENGNTAIDMAILNNFEDVIQMLLSAGSSINQGGLDSFASDTPTPQPEEQDEDFDQPDTQQVQQAPQPSARRDMQRLGAVSKDDASDGDGSEADDAEEHTAAESVERLIAKHELSMYNPADFTNLQINSEIQNLFQFITDYTPVKIQPGSKLAPFIPDYIPAVGDADSFIKVPRPDGKNESLGLKVLDEPSAIQSDPAALTLELEQFYKVSKAALHGMKVSNIENADKNQRKILAWIASIQELHKKRPPPTVNFSKVMPSYDEVMQRFPDEFSDALFRIPLPAADIKMDLVSFSQIICAVLDVPVHNEKLLESLFFLFSLFLEVRNDVSNDIYYSLPTADSVPAPQTLPNISGAVVTERKSPGVN